MKPALQTDSPGGGEEHPIYDWERFWIGRTGTLDLSDAGFLNDPTNPFLRYHSQMPATLVELGEYRALALLGEPGMGKSTTLAADAKRIGSKSVAGDTTSIHVDLRAYSSEILLHQKVFA